MIKKLPPFTNRLFLFIFAFIGIKAYSQQATVYTTDFATSAGSGYTTVNGAVGTSTNWSMLRSGTDMGARIANGMLQLTNDATSTGNSSGWVLAYTQSQQSSPYTAILSQNPGLVTWTFNLRQSRSNPSGLGNNSYGNAFILAGTSNSTATTGSGYAIMLGNNGNTDPIRFVRYANGIRNTTNLLASSTSGVSDFGHHYISVKVTYAPGSNTWELFVRKDSSSSFSDPATGYYNSQGTVTDNTSTGASLPLIGGFWNAGTKKSQTAYFDNIKIGVATPVLTSISPTSKVAGSAQFTLTVTGQNFLNSSVIKWNGTNLATTYVSATQLTATVPAANVATAGTASVTVGTGAATSSPQTFYIDAAGVPSIATSTNAISNFLTVTGTASTAQSFTSSGSSLQNGVITITAPTNFEVANAQNGNYSSSINVGAATATTWVRVAASAPPGIYTAPVLLMSSGATTRQISLSGIVLNQEPTTTATTLNFTNINSVQGTINWSGGNGGNHLVVVRPALAVSATLADGSSYYASTTFGSGAAVGTDSFVVYAGSANSVSIDGLTPNTTYYVSVYEYNGSGGIENYRTTPVSGNFTTPNAPLGLQIKNANTVYTIDFDNTVEGTNAGAYAGAGLSDFPDAGDLNSNGFVLSVPATTAGVTFGGEILDDDLAYGAGTSDGGEADGGFYAFQVANNNYALGLQPDATYPSASITLKMQNQTGVAVTSLNFGYKIYVRNDEAGATSFNFSYSSGNSAYTAATVLNETTVAVADALPGWKVYYKVVTVSNLNIAASSYYYIRWSSANTSGSAFDEIALDDITIVANPTSNFAPVSGTLQTAVLNGNSNLSGSTTVAGGITFNNGKVNIGSNTLTLNGTITNTTTGGLSGTTSSNLVIAANVSPTLSFDASGNTFNNFSVATTANNTVTLGGNIVVNGALTVDENQTLALGANTLTGTLGTITNNGTVTTTNTTTTPFASGKTWGGTGTLIFNAAGTAQYLPLGTYNKVTVSTTAGVTATGNVTFNGDLYLPNANPSATKGSFDTATYTATMGPNASNTGVGDVSGIVARTSGIVHSTLYTFGHPRTAISFPNVGTLPTSMSIKLVLGQAPANKSDGILRTYDFIQTGGTGTKAIISAHYLDGTELNGNDESKLVDWVVQVSPLLVLEQSRTNYNTTENYVQLANVNVAFFSSAFGAKLLTLANYQATTATWTGTVSTSWTTAANWLGGAVPSDNTKVIIPDGATTNFDPTLNPTVTIGTLTVEPGGILNAPADSQLSITGTSGAWINNGTFNPSNGTVTFTAASTAGDATIAGSTTFYNVTVPSGTLLRALTDNVMDIAGTFTKAGTFVAGTVHNTVIYSGTNQTVVLPNGTGNPYHRLVINGTGAVLPATFSITGELITNATVNFAGTTITFNGNDNENQVIGGTVAPVFNNVVINKTDTSHTVELETNATISGTLTLTSGRLDIASYDLTLGANPVAGTFSTTTMIDADGTGHVRRPYTGAGSYTFPIGETTSNTTYSPVTVNVTSGSFNNAYVSVNVTDATHPNNYGTSSYMTRYWSITQTGITGAVATITGTYVPGDAVGGESLLSAAQLNGTFNVVSNPWTKYGLLSSTTLTVANAVLTAGQTSYFTGITAAGITVDVTGEGTYCQNSYVQLTSDISGGVGGYTYQWSNGLGTAATATPSTATIGSTAYTLTVRDANGAVGSDSATVVVTSQPVAGTLSSDQAICVGTPASPITLTDYTGTIVRWERSTTTEFTNPAFIYSSNATLTTAQIGNLTATRYFRAIVQNGSCDVVPSNYVIVKINTTTWNGTAWDNGAPTATDAVVFTGNYTAPASFSACTITVDNNAQVIIPTGVTATVNGAVTVTSGATFTVENNAALVQLTNAVNTGDITVKRNSNALKRLDYTMWGSPVTGSQSLLNFSPLTFSANPSRFYTYGILPNGAEGYISVANPGATPFAPGTGYLIRTPNALTQAAADAQNSTPGLPAITVADYNTGAATNSRYVHQGAFTGVPNNGNISVALQDVNGASLVEHYIAVGNPYPSPIKIQAFFTENQDVISGTIYLWRKRNNYANSSYVQITNAGVVANDADGGDIDGGLDNLYPEGNEANWILSPGQGFIVGALNTGTIDFTNAMRAPAPTSGSQPFFKTNGTNDTPAASKWWLNLTGANNIFSQTLVAYIPQATLGKDYGYDGNLLSDAATALYSKAVQENFGIQARPSFTATDVVPMGFRVGAAGQYNLSLERVTGVFAEGQNIYIKDNLLGTTNLLGEEGYNFTSDAGTFETRFEVVYQTDGELGNNHPELENAVMVYQSEGVINITTGSIEMTGVTIYDISGRKLYAQTGINATEASINNLNVAKQVLIVEIDTINGKVTKRIFY